ncbi:hypothetical protein L21SP3_00816 [Sedimentisphaera cyanobacteriorum]|uniref:DUF1553 domain-containing protein n=1 Tax=Sedimentisphaera cyanobacteriorum TaxID=1940790 RepID=A0A1Q2HN96_9BACT|nr:DUF1553 domain-containing protein [Sedimentisphaera cyanobacteriorum]AQQ09019.1 hypothetical protein L21SP3_00816 [Sedimentisphaera cyanobacteriorum]
MRLFAFIILFVSASFAGLYQTGSSSLADSQSQLDRAVLSVLKEKGLKPAEKCSDTVFLRRIYLDLTGTIPHNWQVREFLKDKSKNKRQKLINKLLGSPEYADYWTMKLCDTLRVKAEFPVNLWPNGVQAYYKWIYDSVLNNKPYDKFAQEILLSSGSNFRSPPVNFYRAIQGNEPETIASAAALTFMGIRLENWPDKTSQSITPFFSRLCYKGTKEWKEEIIYNDPAAETKLIATLPFGGREVTIDAGEDPRAPFVKWLVSGENDYFAENMVNRVWYWLMGSGIYTDLDNRRPESRPVNPKLMSCLKKEFVSSGWDVAHLIKFITSSQTYQQSSMPEQRPAEAEKYFACYKIRRVEAEVLSDILDKIFGGSSGNYISRIPEPFTFFPAYKKAVSIQDGSITSPFLALFGKPSRDTGFLAERNLEPSAAQSRYLLNSNYINSKISRSWKLKKLVRDNRKNGNRIAAGLYLSILSRPPSQEELKHALDYSRSSGLNLLNASQDIAWALVNSREFSYKH